jgi:hypothetical protein
MAEAAWFILEGATGMLVRASLDVRKAGSFAGSLAVLLGGTYLQF